MSQPKPLNRELAAYNEVRHGFKRLVDHAIKAANQQITEINTTPAGTDERLIASRNIRKAQLENRLFAWQEADKYIQAVEVLIDALAASHRDFCDAYNDQETLDQLRAKLIKSDVRMNQLINKCREHGITWQNGTPWERL